MFVSRSRGMSGGSASALCQSLRTPARAVSGGGSKIWRNNVLLQRPHHQNGCQDQSLGCGGRGWREDRGGVKREGSGGWPHCAGSQARREHKLLRDIPTEFTSPSTA